MKKKSRVRGAYMYPGGYLYLCIYLFEASFIYTSTQVHVVFFYSGGTVHRGMLPTVHT